MVKLSNNPNVVMNIETLLSEARLSVCEAEARLVEAGGGGRAEAIAGRQIASQCLTLAIAKLQTAKNRIEDEALNLPARRDLMPA